MEVLLCGPVSDHEVSRLYCLPADLGTLGKFPHGEHGLTNNGPIGREYPSHKIPRTKKSALPIDPLTLSGPAGTKATTSRIVRVYACLHIRDPMMDKGTDGGVYSAEPAN